MRPLAIEGKEAGGDFFDDGLNVGFEFTLVGSLVEGRALVCYLETNS